MKTKERLVNDQGLFLFAQLSCGNYIRDARTQAERVASRRSYVNSFWFENKPFESASLFTSFYDCGVIEGTFARTKTSFSDFSFL